MDSEKKLAKKQRKEAQRIGRKSKEIIGLISDTFQKNSAYEFNKIGLLRDRKSEYWPEDYEILSQAHDERVQKAAQVVQEAGVTTIAHVMRHYCEVLSDPNRTESESAEAMTNAVNLLFIIAQIGKRDTEHLNKAVINACARNVTVKALDDVMYRQWKDRQTFYSPELRAQMLNDLKARTIG